MKKVLFFTTLLGILLIATSCGCHQNDTSSSINSNSMSSQAISSETTSISSNDTSSDMDTSMSIETPITSDELSIALT